jgi:hypothetical protein
MRGFVDQFCRCHRPMRDDIAPPLPENRTDGAGKVVCVTCKRCTRVISCVCPRCGEQPTRMFDHITDNACVAQSKPREKKQDGPWLPGVPR